MKNAFIIIFVLLSFSSNAQRVCGTPSNTLPEVPQGEKSFTSHTFNVYYHILAKNNGNDPTSSLSAIIDAHNALNARFLGSNICFVLSGYDIVENTHLRKWKVVNNGDLAPLMEELFDQNVQSNALNVYIIDADEDKEANKIQNGQLSPEYSTPEGAAEAIVSHSVFIKTEKFTSEILTHEIGHVLGLYHTFEEGAFGIDDPATSSDDDKGDRIPDTPEQPLSCSTLDANCNLTCTLPYNTTALLSNYMNYAVTLSCLSTFTSDQQARMHGTINSTSDLQQRIVPVNRTIAFQNIPYHPLPWITINDIVQEAKGTLTLYDINMQSPGKGAFRAEDEIVVMPGFDAMEGCRALLIIENICKANETQAKAVESVVEYYENEGLRVNLSTKEVAMINQQVLQSGVSSSELTVSPNPFSEEFTISVVTLNEYDENEKVIVEVVDLNGKQILLSNYSYSQLSRDLEINSTAFQHGFYLLRVTVGEEVFISRIVKQ